MPVISLGDRVPSLDPSAWVAPSAYVTGSVTLGADVSIWYSSSVRGDTDRIVLGARTNVQDCSALHTDAGLVLSIGDDVTIGHSATVHGCTVEDQVLIGIGSTILNGAHIGHGSLIGAGALVPPGMVVPPRSLVIGSPGKVKRETTDDEYALIKANAEHYVRIMELHRSSL